MSGFDDKLEFVATQQKYEEKSPQGIYELPCGYLASDGSLVTEIELSEITGVEEDLLAAKNVPSHRKINELLVHCVKRLGNLPISSREFLPDLTVGDRTFLMFAIRRVSLGDEYPFVDKCPGCEQEQLYYLNLADMVVKSMPKPEQRVYDVVLPTGKDVRWHVMTGKDEDFLAKFDKSGMDSISLSILARLDMLDGKPIQQNQILGGKPAALAAIKKLSMRERNALRDSFNDHEGGIDTAITFTCPSCEHEHTQDLDVSQQGFFFPSVAVRAWKKKSSG